MKGEPRESLRSGRRAEDIAAEAAVWVARRDRGLSAGEERAFARWQAADPRHRTELRRIDAAWRGLSALEGDAALDAMADDVVARARGRHGRRRAATFASVALAAAAAVAVAFFSHPARRGQEAEALALVPAERVQVLASTLRRQALPDGSEAELNGNSRIEFSFSAHERRVRLIDGEAHFVVAKDASRPFYVSAGAVTVRAVGTAFNVRLGDAAVEVLVTEGKVQVQREEPDPVLAGDTLSAPPAEPPAALEAGERAVVERDPEPGVPVPAVAIVRMDPAEIERELGWQTTRLVFANTPLPEVVEAFNRYNPRHLVLGDPVLRTRTLTGVFRADNLDGFVRLLRASSDVKAEPRTSTELVLLPVR